MTERFTDHLVQCPSVDKFVAVFGNLGSWLGVAVSGSTWTMIGGLFVSGMTGLYFFARAAHQWQRMQQERQIHDLKLRKFIECPECDALNGPDARECHECGTNLRDP